MKTRFRVGDLELPERRKMHTSSREKEDVATNMCPCGTTIKSRTHIAEGCEIYKEKWDVLEETKEFDECGLEEFGRLESSEKTIAILGDRWWPQTAKQQGDKIKGEKMSKTVSCNKWKKRNERPNVGGVFIGSRTVPRVERDGWSMAKRLKVSNERAPLPPPRPRLPYRWVG